jgi:hypothetical protein
MYYNRTPDQSSMETPALWYERCVPRGFGKELALTRTVIGVDGIHSSLELIRVCHLELYDKCQILVQKIEEQASPRTPEPALPIFSFS